MGRGAGEAGAVGLAPRLRRSTWDCPSICPIRTISAYIRAIPEPTWRCTPGTRDSNAQYDKRGKPRPRALGCRTPRSSGRRMRGQAAQSLRRSHRCARGAGTYGAAARHERRPAGAGSVGLHRAESAVPELILRDGELLTENVGPHPCTIGSAVDWLGDPCPQDAPVPQR